MAVLPHMPLNQITFDPTHESVQIAAELRQKFKVLPNTEVRSPVDVEREPPRKAVHIHRAATALGAQHSRHPIRIETEREQAIAARPAGRPRLARGRSNAVIPNQISTTPAAMSGAM